VSEQAVFDQGAIEQKVSGSSFYAGMRILPKAERSAMFAIYGFCRAVDDIVDEPGGEPAERKVELDAWRSDVEHLYAGEAPGKMGFLAADIRRFGLAKADFLAVIDGMQMDLDQDIRAPDAAMLDLYCDRVASAVGRLSVKVFGMDEAPGLELAHHLGRALQLTNILRDLDEDASIGRLYLPRGGNHGQRSRRRHRRSPCRPGLQSRGEPGARLLRKGRRGDGPAAGGAPRGASADERRLRPNSGRHAGQGLGRAARAREDQ